MMTETDRSHAGKHGQSFLNQIIRPFQDNQRGHASGPVIFITGQKDETIREQAFNSLEKWPITDLGTVATPLEQQMNVIFCGASTKNLLVTPSGW
jgi:hypothetical protein